MEIKAIITETGVPTPSFALAVWMRAFHIAKQSLQEKMYSDNYCAGNNAFLLLLKVPRQRERDPSNVTRRGVEK